MRTETHQKVESAHLERDAYLYVRQSSLRQVMENQESTKRQYALRERAIALGWPIERIHVIDSDLGQSGAQATGRDGFTELVSKVAMGEVGIVLGLEVSRLARNNADWHRLLELSALAGTLILDEDGVYDPTHFNDRLLLGLKGAMSEAELHVLKARLQGGILNKARRGELEVPLPIGLLYRSDGSVEIDPDIGIAGAVRWVFDTFRNAGSAMAVVKRFHTEALQFPRRLRRGINKGQVLWGTLDHSRVLQLLHNPRYAGAFVYGRTRTRHHPMGPSSTQRKVPREQWQVLIPDAHPGYITWDEFERNQSTLRDNAGAFAAGRRGSLPREGAALLQGRVLCGVCGERMQVRYQEISESIAPYYQCTHESVRNAGKRCQSVRGTLIDQAVGELLIEVLTSSAIDAALAVESEITGRIEEAATRRTVQLERARYESELARRRYFSIDPDNRLVANTLEADWNTQLRRLDALQQEHERQSTADRTLLADEQRERIRALAEDVPRVWNDDRTSHKERKRMLALLIEDVTLVVEDRVGVAVRFRGGRTASLSVERPKPMSLVRKTAPEVISALDKLLDTATDHQAAEQLNKQGHRTWCGEHFTAKKVSLVRRTYAMKGRYERLRDRGFLTARELGDTLGVSSTTVVTWSRAGHIERVCWSGGVKSLYRMEPGKTVSRGRGGRRPVPPTFTAASAEQETV